MKLILPLAFSALLIGCSAHGVAPLSTSAAPPATTKRPLTQLIASQSGFGGGQYYSQGDSYLEQRILDLEYRICLLEQKLAPVYFEALPNGGVITRGTGQPGSPC